MPSTHTITRRVEFSETDLAGIMHFSNFFRYMESAEHDFYRRLGLKLVTECADGSSIGWPRVSATCDYKRPLKFQDEVDVTLKVAKKTEKAITYEFSFTKKGEADEAAHGALTVVCCSFRGGRVQATLIPKEFDEKIEIAV
ncbi:MAG TPA: thioesterase family protein [Planctomycetota bacterium]|nr:thioesterase family protein [Planctomycetota bacterium]